jgi:hypothetical protein|tara:strand:- start:275 stop:526 length:252 start_codon:yes stop_codon:yes gene_type:complete
LHLREVCRPSTLRLLGPVARAREHAAYQGGALGVRAPVVGEHQHLCRCDVIRARVGVGVTVRVTVRVRVRVRVRVTVRVRISS